MARLLRPIRQWPHNEWWYFSRTKLDKFFYSPLLSSRTTSHSFSMAFSSSIHGNAPLPALRRRRTKLRNAPPPPNFQEGETSDSDTDAKKSRNQKKRDARRAVRWGVDLATFSTPQIKRILRVASLEQDVFDALMLVKRLGPDVREGKRRQFNYIGKLLREVEPELMDALIQATKVGDHKTLQALAGPKAQVLEEEDDEDEGNDQLEEIHYERSQEHADIANRWFDGLISKDIMITNEVYSVNSIDFDRQELRRLVRKVQTSQEQSQTVTEEDKAKVEAALMTAKKSLTRFLRTLARQLPAEWRFDFD